MGRPKGSWTGESNPRWKGGIRRAGGYIYVQCPEHPNADKTGYVREHVKIMSEHLGRPIAPNEVVHHRNGITDDNRIENLELMTRSEHHSHHHKGLRKPGSIAALKGKTSEEMQHIWNTTRAPERAKPKTCQQCGKQFLGQGKKYCSHGCYLAHRYDPPPRV